MKNIYFSFESFAFANRILIAVFSLFFSFSSFSQERNTILLTVDQQSCESVEIVRLNPNNMTITPGDQKRIYATLSSGTGTYTWTSSDESVATVTNDGIVNAIDLGYATITCTEKGGATATCEVKVVSLIETFTSFPLASVVLPQVKDSTIYDLFKIKPDGFEDSVLVKGYLAETAIRLFSEGAYYANGTGELTGPNRIAIIYLPAFVYYIDHTTCPEIVPEGQQVDYGLTTRAFETQKDTVANGLVATNLDKDAYWTHINAAINAWNEGNKQTYYDECGLASTEGFDGAFMTIYENDEEYGYSPISWMPDAVVDSVRLQLIHSNNVYDYMYYVTGAVQIRPVLGDYGLGVYVDADAFGTMTITSEGLELGKSRVITLSVADNEEQDSNKEQESNEQSYTLKVNAADCYESQSIEVSKGTEVVITAKPKEGYFFYMWSDGITDNPRTVIVERNLQLIAYFVEIQEGVNAFDVTVSQFCESKNLIITLDPSDMTVIPGDEVQINATLPFDTGTYTWTSEDENVATISSTGIVKAINNGTTTITCTEEGGATATCKVNVVSPVDIFTSFPLASYTDPCVKDSTIYDITEIQPAGYEYPIQVRGYLAETNIRLYSQGVYIDNETATLTGPERIAIIYLPAFVYQIDHTTCPELMTEQDAPVYYNLYRKDFTTSEEIKGNSILNLTLDKEAYWYHINQAINYYNSGDYANYENQCILACEKAGDGGTMRIYDYHKETQEYKSISVMPVALVERAYIALVQNEDYNYMSDVSAAVQLRPILGDKGLGVYVEEDAIGKMTIKSTELELGESRFVYGNDKYMSVPTKSKETYFSISFQAEGCKTIQNIDAPYRSTITVTAEPMEGYHFTMWSDGNTDNPRTIILDYYNMHISAFFAADDTGIETGEIKTDPSTPRKQIENNYLYIIMPDGTKYNVIGAKM